MREIADLVAYCAPQEFEDLVVELTGADLVKPVHPERIERARRVYKVARSTTRSPSLAAALARTAGARALDRQYDLFFPVFNNAYELYALTAVPGWRRACRHAACFVVELWERDLPEYLVELLRDFDHVFVGVAGPVSTVARIVGRPCSYLPLGVDALKFCPHPRPPVRAIDVCGIGRRSPITHHALLQTARARGLFYYYDTVRSSGVPQAGMQITFRVNSAPEHRLLISNVLKRSRYFVANRALANDPALSRGQDEIAGRFFEGAAAGTVMIGAPPECEAFRRLFGWQDSVVAIPFDAPLVGETIASLDADPARVERIRRENVVNALLRHDWVYRLRAVLDHMGLTPTAAMEERERRLAALADEVSRAA